MLDVLWESLDTDADCVTEEQMAELDRRVARYELNRDAVIPWEQVRARLFTKQ